MPLSIVDIMNFTNYFSVLSRNKTAGSSEPAVFLCYKIYYLITFFVMVSLVVTMLTT